MNYWTLSIATVVLGLATSASAPATNTIAQTKTPLWEARGMLLEACSCSVPCPCNFNQAPTNGMCHTVYGYKLKQARYGEVSLDGLIIGGGEADQDPGSFLDAKATPAQRPALEKLAVAIFSKGGPSNVPRKFEYTAIKTEVTSSRFSLDFDGSGGFGADVLIGGDGKNPIIVENNTTWPVHRFTKAKTTHFQYHDAHGNKMQYTGVNANVGEFDLKP